MSSSRVHSCESVIAIADEPHHHLEVDNDWVRGYAVEIGLYQSTLCHLHSLPYLMYVAGEADIVSTPRNGAVEKHHFSPDFCEFAPAGLEHVVENLGDAPFRNLIFEVLPATEKLRRAGLGVASAAGVRMTRLYSGEFLCAQMFELSSGSQAQVTGPAVVSSPYEDAIEFISPEHGARKLEHFRQLEYLAEGTTGLLRCESGGPARVLVITLGCE